MGKKVKFPYGSPYAPASPLQEIFYCLAAHAVAVVGMVDAIAAYKEAFSSYRKSTMEYAKYSILLGLLGTVLSLALAVAFFIMLMLFSGSFSALSVVASDLSFGIAGIAAIFIVLGIGALAFIWMEMGLTGAYLETINLILSGKKQTLNGFFSAMPRRATPLTAIAIISSIVMIAPLLAFMLLALMAASGNPFSAVAIVIMLVGALFSFFLFLLMAFAIPCSIVDGKGAIDSVRRSFKLGAGNLAGLVVFYIAGTILVLPALIPFVGVLYAILFAGPVMNGALITMYKNAK